MDRPKWTTRTNPKPCRLGTALAEGAYKALVKLEKKPDAKRVPKGKVSTFDGSLGQFLD